MLWHRGPDSGNLPLSRKVCPVPHENSASSFPHHAWQWHRLPSAGVHWASFHDRLSGDWDQAQQSGGTLFAEGSVNNACLTKTYAKGGQWLDHLTADVLPQTSRRWVYPWRITPDRLHVVEAGWVAPAKPNAGPLEPDQA